MSLNYRSLLIGNGYIYVLNDIINYANSQGWTIPSISTINAMNVYINSLISSDLWNKYDIYYNFGYNDTNLRNFSRINWKNPGNFNITYKSGTLPNYTINGFEQTTGSTGTYSYSLDTNFTPSIDGVNYTLNNASIVKYTTGTFSSTNPSFAYLNASSTSYEGGYYFVTKSGPIVSYRFAVNGGDAGYSVSGPTTLNNRLGPNNLTTLNRPSSTGVTHYINGSLIDNLSSLSTSLPTSSFQILREDYSGSDKHTFSMFAAGSSLTSTNNTDMNNYYNTFRTNIGL